MKLHKLSIAVILSLTLCSCSLFDHMGIGGTMRRAGKDLGVTVMSPVIAIYGGSVDGLAAAREDSFSPAVTQAIVLPPAFVYHSLKHFAYCMLHAADFCATPFYAVAELLPDGPKIKPLDFYTGTIFDVEEDEADADTSEIR